MPPLCFWTAEKVCFTQPWRLNCVPNSFSAKERAIVPPRRWRSGSTQGRCLGHHGVCCVTLSCSGGFPYCWYEPVKWGAEDTPPGSETVQDLFYLVHVLAVQSDGQTLELGRLFGRQPGLVLKVPAGHPDPAAISAEDCLMGVSECEFFNVTAYGPFTDARF